MWNHTRLFRSPQEIAALQSYLVEHEMEEYTLDCFETGFVSHFEYPEPEQ